MTMAQLFALDTAERPEGTSAPHRGPSEGSLADLHALASLQRGAA